MTALAAALECPFRSFLGFQYLPANNRGYVVFVFCEPFCWSSRIKFNGRGHARRSAVSLVEVSVASMPVGALGLPELTKSEWCTPQHDPHEWRDID
jgi:hypothetical protein